ncbi:MAG TPA: beta-eliminating lyase-related protein [Candidatus Thermoplasmatota archaeon]|nr:beta-eliminating lyase-related protein [Candidatus Thermoplasmatota archaeon]
MPLAFASDNNAPVHPKVLDAIARANVGHAPAYGADEHTARVTERFRALFGRPDLGVLLVFNGTGANVLGLAAMARPHDAILCADGAHIYADEANAPERFLGAKLVPVATQEGKLTPALLEPHVKGVGSFHHAQPRVVSITQASELGTVYTRAELAALRAFCDRHEMLLHMDGARLANAVVALGSLADATHGVDVLSFGGTKNGALAAEAVLVFRPELARDLLWTRKQVTQLASKMRYIAAQLEALLEGDLWLENARQANRAAALLANEASAVPGVRIAYPTQANEVFARLPREAIARLRAEGRFEVWDEREDLVRFVCSWDTTENDVRAWAAAIRRAVGERA